MVEAVSQAERVTPRLPLRGGGGAGPTGWRGRGDLVTIGRSGAPVIKVTLCALVLWLGAPGAGVQPARATAVIAKDFAALCAEADMVFVGTVREVHSQWADAAEQSIETLVTFSDLTPLHGAEEGEVTLRFAGGTVDDIREEVAGVPRLAVGERVVIFARHERSISPIVGFNQGCFRVVDGPSGAVVLDVDHRPVPAADGGAFGVAPERASGSSVSLAVFLDRIRRELDARHERRP